MVKLSVPAHFGIVECVCAIIESKMTWVVYSRISQTGSESFEGGRKCTYRATRVDTIS